MSTNKSKSGMLADLYFETYAAAGLSSINSTTKRFRTLGYYSAGDDGGAAYKSVASEPAHAGKIQSASGAWWEIDEKIVFAKMLGAKADDATDDTTVLQNLIDLGFAQKVEVRLNPGIYKTTVTLNLGNGDASAPSTKNGLTLIGYGHSTTAAEYGGDTARMPVRLKWYGSLNGLMMNVAGPINGIRLSGLAFDCNHLAGTALQIMHGVSSRFEFLMGLHYRQAAYIHSAYDAPASCAIGSSDIEFLNVHAKDPGAGGKGIVVGAASVGVSPFLDVARCLYQSCEFFRDGTDASSYSCLLAFVDNVSFVQCHFTAQGGNDGYGVQIFPPAGNAGYPGEISFFSCPIGKVYVPASWTAPLGILFMPYPVGDGEPVPVGNFNGQVFGVTTAGIAFGGFGRAS